MAAERLNRGFKKLPTLKMKVKPNVIPKSGGLKAQKLMLSSYNLSQNSKGSRGSRMSKLKSPKSDLGSKTRVHGVRNDNLKIPKKFGSPSE
jgi:hypothetical protein